MQKVMRLGERRVRISMKSGFCRMAGRKHHSNNTFCDVTPGLLCSGAGTSSAATALPDRSISLALELETLDAIFERCLQASSRPTACSERHEAVCRWALTSAGLTRQHLNKDPCFFTFG